MSTKTLDSSPKLSFDDFKNEVLKDYKIALVSRECSILGRREVLTGKAKFGIFGGGKEVPQLAMAKAFQKGDWRSGYYRDQTFMMAIGEYSPRHFFASLYAHADIKADSFSAGRQMNGHFCIHTINEDGSWKDLTKQYNVSSDISPTSGQMPRLVGLAEASKKYKQIEQLHGKTTFSHQGNEVAWGTIGNASTSEGPFFEAINAAGVLQIPMVVSVWDDAYGISVPAKYQTTKESISEILSGFQRTKEKEGYEIFVVQGWNYSQLVDVYQKAAKIAREEHVPVLIHVTELTQPLGHSTSGSHERYKSEERLAWEKQFDCIAKMREWIEQFELEDEDGNTLKFYEDLNEIRAIEESAKKEVREAKREALNAYLAPIIKEREELLVLLDKIAPLSSHKISLDKIKRDLQNIDEPIRRDILDAARKSLMHMRDDKPDIKNSLQKWVLNYHSIQNLRYNTHLYSELPNRATNIAEIKPVYDEDAPLVDARIVLRDNFDNILSEHPEVLIFGEDSGNIGDVNQGL